jgi:RHS repeat-associated protein
VAEYDGSSHTLFYYDGLHIAEETDSSLNLNRLCLFGVQIDEVLYAGDTDGSGNLTAHRWPLADHLGSVIAVYDNSATEKTAIDYTTVFGETTMSGAETDFPYGFTGRRRLAAAGLYDYRARAYEPKLGRFLQRDPIGGWHDPVNLGNPFGYVGNDPTNDIDPSGLSGYPNETDTRCRDGIYRSGFIDWLIGCTAEFDELCMTKCKDAGYDEGRCVSRIFNPICDCYKYGRGTDGWERLNPLEVIEEASDLVDLATLGGTAAVKKGVKKLARGIVEGGEELVEKGVGKSVEELGGGLGKVIDGIKGLKKGARLTKEQIDALSKNLDLVLKKSLPEKVKRGRGEDIINFLRNDPRWKNLDQIPGAAAKIQEALKAHGLKWP